MLAPRRFSLTLLLRIGAALIALIGALASLLFWQYPREALQAPAFVTITILLITMLLFALLLVLASLHSRNSSLEKILSAAQMESNRRQVAEQTLHKREADYRLLFEANPFPMWVFELESLRFLTVNNAAIQHYGYSREEFSAMTIADIRDPGETGELLEYMQQARPALKNAGIWSHRRKDGSHINVEVVSHVLEWTGKRGRLVLANDITIRREAEAALVDLTQNLENKVAERTAQLSAVNSELEAFAYSVSHDLRAPLRSIDGFSQALQEDYASRLDAEGQRYLQRVRAATQRMGLLIDDLLGLAKVARSTVQRREFDLAELAEDIAADLAARDNNRHCAFTVAKPLLVNADPGLLRVVMQNLLDNAWKFSSKKSESQIKVGLLNNTEDPVIFVRDNGAGFDMQYADKLFGAFQRLHAMQEFDGTGIGLALVQRIIHLHGGTIRAEAEVNKGATFYFTLGGAITDENRQTDSAG